MEETEDNRSTEDLLKAFENGEKAEVVTEPTPPHVLPCFACGASLEPVFSRKILEDKAPWQPADAVMFYAYGQYGSTVFDPQDDSQININICDPCLLAHKDRVWHVRYVRQQAWEIFSKPWDPEVQDD